GEEPILIDEHQRYAPSWDLVRRSVDDDNRPGRFILTGSASVAAPATHSGAGRIVSLRMRPMTLPERQVTDPTVSLAALLSGANTIEGRTAFTLEDYTSEIVRSGLPGVRSLPDRSFRPALASYARLIVDRDVSEAGVGIRNPRALTAWLAALAGATATVTTGERLREAATPGHGNPPARSTTLPWQSALERTYASDPLPAWTPGFNHLGRLTKTPKHHLLDPGLTCAVLNLDEDDLLAGRDAGPSIPRDGTFLGALFESLAALSLRVFAQAAEASVGHMRREGGDHEVDFVVAGRHRRHVALDAKLAEVVDDHDVRHLLWLRDRLGPDLTDMVILTTGHDAYRRQDGVAVVPLALLGP
ncbi:MAG: ATP-binding protein, partial [Actinomycetes bacterium]